MQTVIAWFKAKFPVATKWVSENPKTVVVIAAAVVAIWIIKKIL